MTCIPPFAPNISAGVNTFTSRQSVMGMIIPMLLPNQLKAGSFVKIEAEGAHSSTSTPNLTLGLAFMQPGSNGQGGTINVVIAEDTARAVASAASWPFRLEWRGKCTATGTSGTMVGHGNIEFGTSLTAFTDAPIPLTAALRTITVDTTVAQGIGVCATFSASSGSNNIVVHSLSAQLYN